MDLLHRAVGAPFAVGSAIRDARVFHPHGAMFGGTLIPESEWWPDRDTGTVDVRARLSRGIGLPSRWPDILGLAVRIDRPSGPWDLLLATAYVPARVALVPARSWASARYSTLMAYRTDAEPSPRWLVATPAGSWPEHTTAVSALSLPLSFTMHLGSFGGAPVPAGRLDLDHRIAVTDDEQLSFDPVARRPSGVDLWPNWLSRVRADAYRGSRAGRHARASA